MRGAERESVPPAEVGGLLQDALRGAVGLAGFWINVNFPKHRGSVSPP